VRHRPLCRSLWSFGKGQRLWLQRFRGCGADYLTHSPRLISMPKRNGGAKKLSRLLCALASWRRCVPFENPNGIPALSPAVARHELPWVIVQSKNHQPHRGCDLHRRVRATTPVGLISISDSSPSVAPPSSWQRWAEGRNACGIFSHTLSPQQILTPRRKGAKPQSACALPSWRLRVEKSARPGSLPDYFFFAPSRKAVGEWSSGSASEPVMA